MLTEFARHPQLSAMRGFKLLKVQSPALAWRHGRRRYRFGAHTFLAAADPDGAILCEHHGIARGPGGTVLSGLGGLLPFRDEVIWGEAVPHRTGFYDEAHPQGVLFEGSRAELDARLAVADRVRSAVNARNLPYPWPGVRAGNSNAYFATLLAALGLQNIRIRNELWAPGGRRLLLDKAALARLAAGCDEAA